MKLSEKKSSGDFVPHPETNGVVRGVLVDVTPKKKVPDKFHPGEEKEIFRLVYETEVMDEANGRRFCIWSRPYTPSLNEKANFRKDIKKILGRDLTEIEREEYDTDSLIGKPVQLIIQHEEGTNGQTYAVISFLGPDKSGDPLTPSGKYVRVQDRESNAGGGGSSDTGSSYRKAPAATEDEGRAGWQKTKVHVGKHAGIDLGDLDVEAVKALIDKWLPLHQANAKPKADDKRLAAALVEVSALIGHPADAEPAPVEEAF
jgi:hypothetical protein